MLVEDLEQVLERLVPPHLAEPWDNCGLLVGDPRSEVKNVLAALELTESVASEALAGGFEAIITHHPLLFSPLRRVTELRPAERLVRRLVKADVALFACHTNLDAAQGGLADILAKALGLSDVRPLVMAASGWSKFVGFVPEDALERVSRAVFAAGAGGIGEYSDCAFAARGEGWFTAGLRAHPVIGHIATPERVPEVRWETVVPRQCVGAVIHAFLESHPYEEPAFDVYPVESVVPGAGLGRLGALHAPRSLHDLAADVSLLLGAGRARYAGDPERYVTRVACVPGSGASLVESAAATADVLISGDFKYHDAEKASSLGLALVDVPHELVEDWAFRQWLGSLREVLAESGVQVAASESWRSPWHEVAPANTEPEEAALAQKPERVAKPPERGTLVLRVDGGSRGNPGRSAIGVVLETEDGQLIESFGRPIGVATNNVAEYSALIAGLQLANWHGARILEVRSDSELLVKQLNGEYKVRNAGLKDLYDEAIELLEEFSVTRMRHVPREENSAADKLVNEALDAEAAG
ncbi:MAG TPA: Nif3-like dinuclear metal center hexameric protein [Thermoleophilia bacterium]